MGKEDSTRSRRTPPGEVLRELAEDTARLLFAHLEAGGAPETHAERAREIYDHIRRLTVPVEGSWTSERAQTEPLEETFKAGVSGVAPKVRR